MENKYKYIIIAAAFIVAIMFYFFGIRRLTSNQLKKKNFFTTSLVIALALIGCNFSSSGLNNKNIDKMDNIFGNENSKRIKELNKTKEWRAFKTFWKSLDNIEPSKGAETDSFQPYISSDNEDYNKKNKQVLSLREMNEELKNGLLDLVRLNLLDPLEPAILFDMCKSRIDYIFYGSISMMTRMMPMPGVYEKEKSIKTMEFKIDTLLKLERKGKIDSAELKLALKNIQLDIKKYSVLEILDKGNMLNYYYFNNNKIENNKPKKDTLTVFDKSILDFENAYNDFMKKYDASNADQQQKDLYDKYMKVKKELDTFIIIYPEFCELIEDLIVND